MVCDRFGGYPSDYCLTHDISSLFNDYIIADKLNEIDRKNKEAELKAKYGIKKNG